MAPRLTSPRPYVLSFDVGTNSIGWACLYLDENGDPCEILRVGSRIFSDGRDADATKSPLAENRRLKRQERRQRYRRQTRQQNLINTLVRENLVPADPRCRALASSNPYELRVKGLDAKLSLYDFGRALYHLAKRRGPRSERLQDNEGDVKKKNEKGVIRKRINQLNQDMQDYRTYGEFLHSRLKGREALIKEKENPSLRCRSEVKYYHSRGIIEHEFYTLWSRQAAFHPEVLTEEMRDRIHEIIFTQRDLKPVAPGRCTFNPNEDRLHKALVTSQEVRIWQEVHNLRIYANREERTLTQDEKQLVVGYLQTHAEMSFAAIRKILKLGAEAKINLEGITRDKLNGDATGTSLRKPEAFGSIWDTFPVEKQNEIVHTLVTDNDEDRVLQWLRTGYNLDDTRARYTSAVSLPSGYVRLGATITNAILPHLRRGLDYTQACQAAGYHHSDMKPTERFYELPPYHELKAFQRHLGLNGRVSNPTVNIVLGQIRYGYNEIVRKYGPPERIVVETTRSLKQSFQSRKRIQEAQQTDGNLLRLFKQEFPGMEWNRNNRNRFRLWVELPNKCCVYSGQPIPKEKLFSDEIEVDHIIPRAISFDDGIGNLILCYRDANRIKRKKTPSQAFKSNAVSGYNWKDIQDRVHEFATIATAQKKARKSRKTPSESETGAPTEKVKKLPPSTWAKKKLRFTDDYVRNEEEFLNRQLNDTAYASTLVREYLQHAIDPNNVYGVPGVLTGLLRQAWSMGRITASCHHNEENYWKVLSLNNDGSLNIVPLWRAGGSHDIRQTVSLMALQKHGAQQVTVNFIGQAKLRKYWSPLSPPEKGNWGKNPQRQEVVVRKNTESLSRACVTNSRDKYPRIRSHWISKDLVSFFQEKYPGVLENKDDKAGFISGLQEYQKEKGIRRIRVLYGLKSVVVIEKKGVRVGVYQTDSIHHMDITENENGRWASHVCAPIERATHVCPENLKMRLFQGDIIRLKIPLAVSKEKVKGKDKSPKDKDRGTHRHHAIDAAIIACISRSLVKKVSTATKMAKYDLIENLEQPWPTFREDVRKAVKGILVSHRPEHGDQMQLFNETNYGIVIETSSRLAAE